MKPCGNGLFLFPASLCLSSSFSPLFSDYLAKVGIVGQTCSLLFSLMITFGCNIIAGWLTLLCE